MSTPQVVAHVATIAAIGAAAGVVTALAARLVR